MNFTVPAHYTDTGESISKEMSLYFFVNSILLILNSIDFSKETIERKCKKGVPRESKNETKLTTKQVNLMSWIYVLNHLNKSSYEMKQICAGIQEIQGIPFVSNPNDLSVWFTDIGDFLIRDKANKITRVKKSINDILDVAIRDGFLDIKITQDVRNRPV